MDYKLIITLVVCWILPAILNLWYFFCYRPQWQTIGGLLWRILLSIIPFMTAAFVAIRYLDIFQLILSKKINPEEKTIKKFISDQEKELNEKNSDAEISIEIVAYNNSMPISAIDLMIVLPLSLIVIPIGRLLQINLRKI